MLDRLWVEKVRIHIIKHDFLSISDFIYTPNHQSIPSGSLAGLYLSKLPRSSESTLVFRKTSVVTFLCTFQYSVATMYPSVANCGWGLKREYAGKTPRGVPRLPSGNAYFARLWLAEVILPGMHLSYPGCRGPVFPLNPTTGTGQSFIPCSFLIPTHISPGIPQQYQGDTM